MRRREGAGRAPWTLRVLLFLVALGVVLMHHVAGAHQHAPDAAPVVAGHAGHAGHAAAASPTAAALHLHHGAPGDDPAGTLHDCLAVLAAAAAALAVAVALLVRWHPRSPSPGGTSPSVRLGEAPAPPTPVPLRLAQLQVLRR